MPRAVDVGKSLGGNSVVVLEEHDDERTARIGRENREHDHKLWKDKIAFLLVVGAGAILFAICGYVLLFADTASDPASRDLAKVGITALFTGLVSFLAGQKMK